MDEAFKKLCPVDDSQYQIIENYCFYFEKNSLNYDNATYNCKEKLGNDYGGLYEPSSIAEQEKVAKLADEVSGLKRWAWLGVTDKRIEAKYAYNSNNSPIEFSPNWYGHYGSLGTDNNCVIMDLKTTSDSFTQWADKECNEYRPSICQSKLISFLKPKGNFKDNF